MIVVKYALAALLVVIGLAAYTRRDVVLDAYDWDTSLEKTTFPTFDPKTVAEQHHLEVPRSDIEVATGPDTRRAVLPTVTAPTTTVPVALQGGRTTIGGVVVGPGDAPVAGAVVRIERFEGESSTGTDVTTNGAGAFAISELKGGRYRLRAWAAPTYAQLGSEVAFVGDGEQRSFRLTMSAPNAVRLSASGTPQIILGQTGEATATFRREAVTRDGRVAYETQPGQVITVLGGGIFLGFGASLTSDGQGTVTVPVACTALGAGSFTFSSAGTSATASVTCAPVPTTTTTTTVPPTTAPGTPAPPAPTPATTA